MSLKYFPGLNYQAHTPQIHVINQNQMYGNPQYLPLDEMNNYTQTMSQNPRLSQFYPQLTKFETDLIAEQLHVMDKDYDFQVKRIIKIQSEELQELQHDLNEYRNQNFKISDINMRIFKDVQQWKKDIYEKNNEEEIASEIQLVINRKQDDINNSYIEQNPVTQELQKDLKFLIRENQDLNTRFQELEKEYCRIQVRQKEIIPQQIQNLHSQSLNYEPRLEDKQTILNNIYNSIDRNQTKNDALRERARNLAKTEINQMQTQKIQYNQQVPEKDK